MPPQTNLTKANQILADIASKDPHITPVTLKDYDLFQSFFDKEPHSYGNSWTYITQGVYGIGPNNLGYKYFDGENISIISISPKVEQPEVNAFYWVKPMGKSLSPIIRKMSKQIKKHYNISVYTKKINQELYSELMNIGFKSIDNSPWFSQAPSEDDTCPERIINIKYTLDAARNASKHASIHRCYQYYRNYEKKQSLQMDSIYNFKEQYFDLLDRFFNSEYAKIHGRGNNMSCPEDYFNLFYNKHPKSKILENIILDNKTAIGFYYIEIQGQDYASLYATITDRKLNNHLADFIFFHIFNTLSKSGIKFLNLGGSENQSLDNFKLKFQPKESNQFKWAVLV